MNFSETSSLLTALRQRFCSPVASLFEAVFVILCGCVVGIFLGSSLILGVLYS
jgi:hypothetical protein